MLEGAATVAMLLAIPGAFMAGVYAERRTWTHVLANLTPAELAALGRAIDTGISRRRGGR